MLRTGIERLVRGTCVWRTLRNGQKVAVSPDAQLRYLAPTFDTDLFRLSRQFVKPGDVVWDIGANCGVFSFLCSHAADVLAVEPDPFLCGLIEKSIERNSAPVRVLQAAVSERRGTADFSIAARGRAANHLSDVKGSTQSGGERRRLDVQTYRLDDLLKNNAAPSFVKINVQQGELLALRGAERLLREVRPLIYIELSRECRAACLQIFWNAGYDLQRHHGKNWLARPS